MYIFAHRAAAAQKNGLFDDEIVPVRTQLIDKDGNETSVVVRNFLFNLYRSSFDVCFFPMAYYQFKSFAFQNGACKNKSPLLLLLSRVSVFYENEL